MDTLHRFSLLLDRHPLVFAHLVCALGALAVGAWLLWGRKGDTVHRSVGWAWVGLMGGAALSAAFIRDYHLPNIAGFTPIHLFVVMVAVQLPLGVWHARRGRVEAHRRTMRGLYRGGCLVAGAFTLLPGRFLGSLLWPQLAALVA
jgi:uncharacterized membrane protein